MKIFPPRRLPFIILPFFLCCGHFYSMFGAGVTYLSRDGDCTSYNTAFYSFSHLFQLFLGGHFRRSGFGFSSVNQWDRK